MEERLKNLAEYYEQYYGEENRIKNLEEKFDNLKVSLDNFIDCYRKYFEDDKAMDFFRNIYTERLAEFFLALSQFIVRGFVNIDKLKEYFDEILYQEYITKYRNAYPLLTSKEKEFLKKEIDKNKDNIDYIVREYDDKKFYLHIIFKDKQDKKIGISNEDYNGLGCTIHYNLEELGL